MSSPSTAPIAAGDQVIGELLTLHMRLDAVVGEIARSTGFTPQQAMLLCVTETSTPSMHEIAELFSCDKSNVTGLVNRLVERNLVDRQADPDDARVVRIAATDEGRRQLEHFHTELRQTLGNAVDGLDPKTVALLLGDLARRLGRSG